MTSGKYCINWIKEAGRGHLVAILSWGSYLILLGGMMLRLQMNLLDTFFGMGANTGVFMLSAGLGLLIGILEFSYLLQERKQDFYFSLPVKKSTVFFTSYLHGLIHGLLPMVCYMLICGIYQSSFDSVFMGYSVEYTFQSILVYGILYLLFYHMMIFAVCVCGKWISVCGMILLLLFGAQIFLRNVCLVFMTGFYETFYRNPVLELLEMLLVPWKLGQDLSGQQIYEKFLLLEYSPEVATLLAGVVWVLLLLLLSVVVRKHRKAESVGRVFTVNVVEKITEAVLAILAGTGVCGLLLSVTEITEMSRFPAVLILLAAGVLTAVIVHIFVEYMVQTTFLTFTRRKGQMLLECAAVAVIVCALAAGAGKYDSYLPKDSEVKSIGIALFGVDMDMDTYYSMKHMADDYQTDALMEKYEVSEEGKDAAMGWIRLLNEAGAENEESALTKVTVCLCKNDGKEVYRTYSVTEEQFMAFADVYETAEYKDAAYPLITQDTEISEGAGFVWDDGVSSQTLKLSDEEKKTLMDLYKKDVTELRMNDLKTAFPIGTLEIRSEVYDRSISAVIYPFFEESCEFLRNYGADIEKELFDYQVETVVQQISRPAKVGWSGGVSMHRYETAEEIEEWRGKLVPREFCIQPLLHPADTEVQTEIEIKEPESGAVISVDCYGK